MEQRKRVCVIGAGPCGMAALNQLSKLSSAQRPEVVCYEKQSTWGGIWNFSWLTGRLSNNYPFQRFIQYSFVLEMNLKRTKTPLTVIEIFSAELSKIDFALDLQKLRPMECCNKT